MTSGFVVLAVLLAVASADVPITPKYFAPGGAWRNIAWTNCTYPNVVGGICSTANLWNGGPLNPANSATSNLIGGSVGTTQTVNADDTTVVFRQIGTGNPTGGGAFVFPFNPAASCTGTHSCPSTNDSLYNPRPLLPSSMASVPVLGVNNQPAVRQARSWFFPAKEDFTDAHKVQVNFTRRFGSLILQYATTVPGTVRFEFVDRSGVAPNAVADIQVQLPWPTVANATWTQPGFVTVFLEPNANYPNDFATQFNHQRLWDQLNIYYIRTPVNIAIDNQLGAAALDIGSWFTLATVMYGKTGESCLKQTTHTFAVIVNTFGLPEDLTTVTINASSTSVTQDFSGNDTDTVVCIPPTSTYFDVNVEENHKVSYNSYVDGILAGTRASVSCPFYDTTRNAYRSCYHDPRAKLQLNQPCSFPEVDAGNLYIGLYSTQRPGPYRLLSSYPLPDNYVWVLAKNGMYAGYTTYNNGDGYKQPVLPNFAASPQAFNCSKIISAAPRTCGVTAPALALPLVFRSECPYYEEQELVNAYSTELLAFPSSSVVNLHVWFESDDNIEYDWYLNEVQNRQNFTLCVPAWGVYHFAAQEINTYNGVEHIVQSENATANCTAAGQYNPTSICQSTVLNLVSVMLEPPVCERVSLCEGQYADEVWVGADEHGFHFTIDNNGNEFRSYHNVNPFKRYGFCVLNLNTVALRSVIPTTQPSLSAKLEAVYDCSNGPISGTGLCNVLSAPDNFFSTLKVDSTHLPHNINYEINYVENSVEDGCVVCSSAPFMYSSLFCKEGGEIAHICVPAVGSDKQNVTCFDDQAPHRLELVAEECPSVIGYTSHRECFPAYGFKPYHFNTALFGPNATYNLTWVTGGGGRTVRGDPYTNDPDGDFPVDFYKWEDVPCVFDEMCNDPQDFCITKTVQLDCRDGCSAVLAQKLDVFDLVALPLDVEVDLLPPTAPAFIPDHDDDAVRHYHYQGACPHSYWVLSGDLRVRVTEGIKNVTSGIIDCSIASTCAYDDFLNIVDLSPLISFNGLPVLEDVTVYFDNLSRSSYRIGAGCVQCHTRQIAVLKDNCYDLQVTWMDNDDYHTHVEFCCNSNCKYCDNLPSLVRWFAIDPTCPEQEIRNIDYAYTWDPLTNKTKETIDEDYGDFKQHGDPWGEQIWASINDRKLTSRTWTSCENVTYIIYYTLAASHHDGDEQFTYPIDINQGCASSTFLLNCSTSLNDTGIKTCESGSGCNAAPAAYFGACHWLPLNDPLYYEWYENEVEVYNPLSQLPLGPIQTDTCVPLEDGDCFNGWQALQPLVNINVDLRCLPDGSSNLPKNRIDPLATSADEDNWRGANYTNHEGVLTSKQNPIDIYVCCGTCESAKPPRSRCTYDACGDEHYPDYCEEPVCKPGSSCDCPLHLEDAGGYQNLFCGLFSPTAYSYKTRGEYIKYDQNNQYRITVQERFRDESRNRWMPAAPQSQCSEDAYKNGDFCTCVFTDEEPKKCVPIPAAERCDWPEYYRMWDRNIEALRPTRCYSHKFLPRVEACQSVTGQMVTCPPELTYDSSYTFEQCNFIARFDKPCALNQGVDSLQCNGVNNPESGFEDVTLSINYTYAVKFQRDIADCSVYLNEDPAYYCSWSDPGFGSNYTKPNQTVAMVLLRPNKLAVPYEWGICVLQDKWYALQVQNLNQPATSSPFTANPGDWVGCGGGWKPCQEAQAFNDIDRWNQFYTPNPTEDPFPVGNYNVDEWKYRAQMKPGTYNSQNNPHGTLIPFFSKYRIKKNATA